MLSHISPVGAGPRAGTLGAVQEPAVPTGSAPPQAGPCTQLALLEQLQLRQSRAGHSQLDAELSGAAAPCASCWEIHGDGTGARALTLRCFM